MILLFIYLALYIWKMHVLMQYSMNDDYENIMDHVVDHINYRGDDDNSGSRGDDDDGVNDDDDNDDDDDIDDDGESFWIRF